MRTVWALLAALTICARLRAADPPSKDTRIALRYGFGDVLIVGGECTDYASGHSQLAYSVPLMPAMRIFVTTPELLAYHPATPATGWKIGDRWKIYPGSGAPLTVIIQKTVLFEYAHSYHDGAVAHMVEADGANRIAGLRATEYLAAPGEGLAGVSQTPLLPERNAGYLPDEDSGRISPVLLRAARKIVGDENWKAEDADSDYVKKMIVELNAGFLKDSFETRFPNELRILRWPLPGQQPLLFVQAVWSREDGPPLFAVDAVMERNSLKIISFDTGPAETTRTGAALRPNCTVGSVRCPPPRYSSTMDEIPKFLNAWKIGNQYFVLTYSKEFIGTSFAVTLEELSLEGDLIPTGLFYRVRE